MRSHEDYIRDVAAFAVTHADLNPSERDMLAGIKLVYGSGPTGTRGVTFFNRWKGAGCDEARPFVEVSAFGQESVVQLTGTTLHELGHVLGGWQAGHGKLWHEACERLGLLKMLAGGTDYTWEENFAPWIADYARSIEQPNEGAPVRDLMSAKPIGAIGFSPLTMAKAIKGCQAGIGTRGGTSRGVGSGSRLRLFECDCQKPIKVRLAADDFDAIHNPCGKAFHKVD